MLLSLSLSSLCFFFFNDTATTEIYTLSLHDALPICHHRAECDAGGDRAGARVARAACAVQRADERLSRGWGVRGDRKSTRLNSSHSQISYAVFCLKKKKKNNTQNIEDTNKEKVDEER